MHRRYVVVALLLTLFAILRIVATYTVLSATYDEPMHISAGLQLLTQHEYTYQYENPPVPRAIFAVAPLLGGMKFDPKLAPWDQVTEVFYANGRYKTNLVLARAGNLLFFLLGSAVTWSWARTELGAGGALLAIVLFTFQPMVLGHSGLATHDAAGMATFALATFVFTRWLDRPSIRNAFAFGAAYGFAITCKYSSIGYVPAACIAVWLVRRVRLQSAAKSLAVASVACALVTWAGFAFTIGEIGVLREYPDVFGTGLITRHPHWPLPAPALFLGIGALAHLSMNPWSSFLFGRVSTDGFWWYFPAAVLLKTTIGSLALAAVAVFRRTTRVAADSIAAAAAILIVAMPVRLDIGVRYVLPLYVPLSIAAASATLSMLRDSRRNLRVAAIVLLVWHCGASLAAHPDEFPYFNELAGRHPERYLVDSNIDWGQDVLRLRDRVRKRNIDRIGVAILGMHDYDKLGFPPHYEAQKDVPSAGWVAVSETPIVIFGRWKWLHGHYERIGKSIRLYCFP